MMKREIYRNVGNGGGAVLFAVLLAVVSGCARVKVEPIKVEPIEINLNVRMTVQQELNDFFGDLDEKEQTLSNE